MIEFFELIIPLHLVALTNMLLHISKFSCAQVNAKRKIGVIPELSRQRFTGAASDGIYSMVERAAQKCQGCVLVSFNSVILAGHLRSRFEYGVGCEKHILATRTKCDWVLKNSGHHTLSLM